MPRETESEEQASARAQTARLTRRRSDADAVRDAVRRDPERVRRQVLALRRCLAVKLLVSEAEFDAMLRRVTVEEADDLES